MATERRAGGPAFQPRARRAVTVSREELTRSSFLDERRFPLVVEPAVESLVLADWIGDRRDEVARLLLEHGAILFRGFALSSVAEFEAAARALSPDLLDYTERAAPRRQVGSKAYTSTEFPAHQVIPMHHEMSYSHNWPTRIWFYCEQPPAAGGRTPITDERRLIEKLDAGIQRPFREKRVMYVRNYGVGLDLTWQEAFQTEDRAAVERYCRQSGIAFEWLDGDRLRTRQVRQAVATHPATGDTVWFNHAHMFHASSLEPAVRAALRAQFAEDELPRNAFYGDGTPIPEPVLDAIRDLYEREAVRFDWRRGDVLLLDNFLAAHGREAFTAPRRIVVAMSDLHTEPAGAGAA
jgi:alpha-ketoglutarate-dependent taurine dioxygenase